MKRFTIVVLGILAVCLALEAAEVKITIPDGQVARYVNALAIHHRYEQDKKPDETKAQFVRRKEIERIKAIVKQVETDQHTGNMAEHLKTKENEWVLVNPKPKEITAE